MMILGESVKNRLSYTPQCSSLFIDMLLMYEFAASRNYHLLKICDS
jgi:hypothetical protein